MTLQYRALGISLLLHTLLVGLFFLWLSNDVQKKPDKPLKIRLSSFAIPAPQSSQPLVPQKQQELTPAMVKKVSSPPVISTPNKPSPVISRPTPPVTQTISQPIPTPAPVEAPKPVAVVAPPPPPVNVEKEFLNAHLGEIRGMLLQNLKYPKMAQKLKMQGEVRITFLLGTDGSVDNVKVVESSGFEILDEDAVSLIEKTASKFPKPSKSVRITVPLSYVLR